MIKKTITIICLAFLVSACTSEKQAVDDTLGLVIETEAAEIEEKEEQKPQAEEPVIDLQPLSEKKWSNEDESIYVKFTNVSESTLEFMVLKTDETPVKEFFFTATPTAHTIDQWSGTLTTATESTTTDEPIFSDNQVTITTQGNSFEITVGELFDFQLIESAITQEEWDEYKRTLKELSDQEVIDFISTAESSTANRFAEAFVDGEHGYFYDEEFQAILNSIEGNYTEAYKTKTLRTVYDNPIYLLETLYAFPMADTDVINYQVIRTPDLITIFIESEFYGYSAYTRYQLTAENKEWKISSRDSLIGPETASYAALSVSGEDEDPDAYGDLVNPTNFDELVSMVQSSEYYYINTYLDYDEYQVFLGHYKVDPLTGMVYYYDRVNDESYELGKAFEE